MPGDALAGQSGSHERGAPLLTAATVRRSIVLSLAAGAIALAAVALVIRDRDGAVEPLRMVDPAWLGLAGAFTVAAWMLRVWRSQVLAAALGVPVAGRRVFRYYLSSVFVSHVTPTSGGGLPLFIYFMGREGLGIGKASALAVVDSGLVTVLLLVAWPAAAVWRGAGMGVAGAPAATAVAGAVLAATGLLLAVVVARPRAIAAVFLWVSRRIAPRGEVRRPRLARLMRVLVRESLRFGTSLRGLVLRRPGHLVAATGLTAVYWLAYLSIAWAVGMGMDSRADWIGAALRQLAFNVLQPFIPTPGGSGGAELLMAYLFRGTLPPGRLAVFVGAWRFFTFYASLAVGGAMLVRSVRARSPGGRQVPAPAEPSG